MKKTLFLQSNNRKIKERAMNTIAMNHLWSYLQGLAMTTSNQRWLANRLIETAQRRESQKT